MKTIGIKLADGSFYPLLEEGKPSKKSINLTTVQDNQTIVHVDVYRSETGTMEDAEYIDTLEIKDLKPHTNGEPSFNLDIVIDENNELSANIHDPETGNANTTQVELSSKMFSQSQNPPIHFEKDPTISEATTEDSSGVMLDDNTLSEGNFLSANQDDFEQNPQDSDEDKFTISQDEIENIGFGNQNKEQEANVMLGASPNDEEFSFDLLNDSQKNKSTEEQNLNEENIVDDNFDFNDFENSVDLNDISLDDSNVEDIDATVTDVSENASKPDSDDSDDSVKDSKEFVASPVGIKVSKGHKHSTEKKVPSVDEVIAENSLETEDSAMSAEDAPLTEDFSKQTADFDVPPVDENLTEDFEKTADVAPTENVVQAEDSLLTEDFTAQAEDVSLSEDFVAQAENSQPTEDSSVLTEDSPVQPSDSTALTEDFASAENSLAHTNVNLESDKTLDDFSMDNVPEEDFSTETVSDDFADFSTEGLDDEIFGNENQNDDNAINSNSGISAVGLSSAFDSDIGEPDLSTEGLDDNFDDSDLDSLKTKDPTFEPKNDMFSDLYDKETIEGNSSYSAEDDVKKKTKVPVIICITCAIICILAALFVLFIIPSKFNLLKKSQATKENIELTENELPVDENAENPDDLSAETEEFDETLQNPEDSDVERQADFETEDLNQAQENIAENPEENAAQEDEIVIATSPEAVVPQEPEPSTKEPEIIRYKIKWGDTLWDISNAYYKNPWRYKYLANYNGIKNPDYIISGTWLLIPAE